jgi:hypothetical protein
MNKSVAFLVPLLKINPTIHFGKGNFLNAYVSIEDKEIIIEIKDKFISREYWNDDYYLSDIESDRNTFLIFYKVPIEFEEDFYYFLTGKYSLFSNKAKQLIIKYSGLVWRKKTKDNKIYECDEKLLALTKDIRYKKIVEKRIGQILPENAELYSVPDLMEEVL